MNNGTTFYCVFYNFLNIFEGILLVRVLSIVVGYCIIIVREETIYIYCKVDFFVFKLKEKEVMRSYLTCFSNNF